MEYTTPRDGLFRAVGQAAPWRPRRGSADAGPAMLFFGTPLLGGLGGYIARRMGYSRDQRAISPATRVGHFAQHL